VLVPLKLNVISVFSTNGDDALHSTRLYGALDAPDNKYTQIFTLSAAKYVPVCKYPVFNVPVATAV